MSNFTNNLRIAMNRKGYTSADMAAALNITDNEFSVYANGICEPDPTVISKMADRLNVTVGDLGGDAELTFTTIGEELQRLRKHNKLNVTEAAMVIGIAPSVLGKIERGVTKTMTKATRAKFAQAYGDDFRKIERKYFEPTAKKEMVNRKRHMVAIKPETETDRAESMRIRKNMDAAMESIGMKQEDLANRADISMSTLNRIRLYGFRPTAELAERISKILGKDIMEGVNMTVEKPEPMTVEQPKDVVTSRQVEAQTQFNKGLLSETFNLLDFIEDDREYRVAVKELVNYLTGGEVSHTGLPQADLVLKMVQSRKAG